MIHIIKNYKSNYEEDPIRFFNFEDYNQNTKDCILFIGAHPDNSIYQNFDLPKFFLSTEEQTWDLDSTNNYVPHVEKIFTICDPKITKREKREFIFFPTNEKIIPSSFDKIFDVIYTGYANAPHVDEILSVISNYNYCFVSFTKSNHYVTHVNVPYIEKLNLISKSKITVVHNLTGNYTPQLKSRPFEAAFSKSLILCKKDDWNFIETWFEPNTEFLYYNNSEELKKIIDDVLVNYEKYIPIIEKCYNRAINNYTTKHFVKKYLS